MKAISNLLILCGGRSAEHEVSLVSAHNVVKVLQAHAQAPRLSIIAIDKTGLWRPLSANELGEAAQARCLPEQVRERAPVCLIRLPEGTFVSDSATRPLGQQAIDVAFPILHGPFGEDGSIQGYLKTLGVPFVGASVLGSAVGMDKDVMKRLLRDAGLPIGRFVVIHRGDLNRWTYVELASELGSTFFVKSANLGSSIGVHKVTSSADFIGAIQDAFLYDNKVVVEEFISGREIECSVLGNSQLRCSLPGEIRPTHDFYTYAAKYLDDKGAELVVPAQLNEATSKQIQELARRAFLVLECSGLARVDFFVTPGDQVFINEINTLPGFTPISMYPIMWQASGLSYTNLIDEVLTLALDRHRAESALRTSITTSAER